VYEVKFRVIATISCLQAEPFWKAVDVTEFPQYREYVAHPMDLSLLERNIKKRMYGSTEAFLADTKWVLHNCIIFNTCKLVFFCFCSNFKDVMEVEFHSQDK
jgi:hypothetical protein